MGMSLGINRGLALNNTGGANSRNDAYWNADFLATGVWNTSGIWRDDILINPPDFLATGRWNRSGIWDDALLLAVGPQILAITTLGQAIMDSSSGLFLAMGA